MRGGLDALLRGIVDYAGLFPPAALDMAPAAEAYDSYLRDLHRAMLGRFVVPVARLAEFEREAEPYLTGNPVWRLSGLTGPDVTADLRQTVAFNDRMRGRAVIDSLELKVSTTPEIESAMSQKGAAPDLADVRAFFEVPVGQDPTDLLKAVKRSGGLAKIRTGGITAEAFPSVEEVARFLLACATLDLPFKATAGLHHPIRAEYRLTYEPEPPRGTMYGYLNVFVAALLARTTSDPQTVAEALQATAVNDFLFTDTSISFRDHLIPLATVTTLRESFAISFGSCSFREPVDDLGDLGLL